MIDVQKIIDDTYLLIDKSPDIKDKLENLEKVTFEKYKKIHRHFLTPTFLKINCEDFKSEIRDYSNYFSQWGKHHADLPRYGAALVNLDGIMHRSGDPVNGSLYEWNAHHPNESIIESDCKMPTEIMHLNSLADLKIFDSMWYRSNILKWHAGAKFVPHIDNIIPAPWIRLWGTTTSNISLRYWNHDSMISVEDIEPGRIYIIDTAIVHDAEALEDDTFQFFLCVSPDAVDILENII
jgi:hypothetical protein